MKPAILTDLTKCVGCKACVFACKEQNGLSRDDEGARLSATTWTTVEQHKGVNVRRQCLHCEEPTCASVCPVAALKKTSLGPVVYDASICLGCRYCIMACPFGVPTYEWSSNAPRVRKCIMCFDERVSKGREPACTSACPTGATVFGDRDALLREASRRMQESPGKYVDRVYGEREAGGTSVLYLSAVPFEELGFKTVKTTPYPELTWNVLSKLPNVVSVAGVGLFGIWWIINRRDTLDRVRRGEMTLEEAMGKPTHEEGGHK